MVAPGTLLCGPGPHLAIWEGVLMNTAVICSTFLSNLHPTWIQHKIAPVGLLVLRPSDHVVLGDIPRVISDIEND